MANSAGFVKLMTDDAFGRSRNIIRISLLVCCSPMVVVGVKISNGSHRYGYHVPAVRKRDIFYSKLEEQRAANAAA